MINSRSKESSGFFFAGIITAALLLAACHSPQLLLGSKSGPVLSATAPTVSELVDHIACELGKTYDQNAGLSDDGITDAQKAQRNPDHIRRWQRLVEGNFVASIDLNLMVTRVEGLSPSASSIWPLTGAGNKIHAAQTIFSAKPGQMATTATNNFTLALGFQLSSTADRNVEQDFMIDMRSLIAQYHFSHDKVSAKEAEEKWYTDHPGEVRHVGRYTRQQSSFPYCLPRTVDAKESYAISASPLKGNLALFEMIEDGLVAIDRASLYNIYGTSGPTRLADVIVPPPPAHALQGVATPNTNGGGAASATSGKTSFGSKVDFFIISGINGGPSYSTLNWKIAAGSGGGGGGAGAGGGGAGGGGAGGGGGGGGGQFANYTRSTQDSLTVTFGATCEAAVKEQPIPVTLIIPSRTVLGDTQKDANQVALTEDANTLGIARGMPVLGSTLAADTKIDRIADNGLTIWLTRPPIKTDRNVALTVELNYAPAEITDKDNTVLFPADVRKEGWRAGMPVSGIGISADTTIMELASDGLSATLSKPTSFPSSNFNGKTTLITPSIPIAVNWSARLSASGTTTKGTTKVTFDANLRDMGWEKGMALNSMAGRLPPDSIIHNISVDGRTIEVSQRALSDGVDNFSTDLRYDMDVTLPHSVSLNSPRFAAGVFATQSSPSSDLITIYSNRRATAVGTVQWSGYVLSTGEFSLRGNVSSGVTGQTVGQIWLLGNNDKDFRGGLRTAIIHFPKDLASKLNDDSATAGYWDSIPPCDTITAAQKQSVIDAVTQQNQYQTFFRR